MMTEEDEEVLFDQAGLLTNNIKTSPEIPRSRKTCRLLRTFFICAAFFGLGLCIAIPGPTLLDLQARTNTSTEQISRIFFGRSMGYLSGSIIGGFLFDIINQNCLLAVVLLVTAVGTAAAPWSTNYLVLMGTFALQGASMGVLDTGGNVACLHIWGRSSGPAMQALHFSFGLGAFVAPLIAEPFLSHEVNETYFNFKLQTVVEPNNLALNRHSRSADLFLKNLKFYDDHDETPDEMPNTPDDGLINSLINKINKLYARFKRDASLTPDDKVADNTLARNETDHVKKPITNAEPLSKDLKVADGSKVGKVIAKMPKPKKKKVPTATLR